MKRILYITCCLLACCISSQGQKGNRILTEYMTLEEATQALLREISNIECCYLDDSLEKKVDDSFKRPFSFSGSRYTRQFELTPREDISYAIRNQKRESKFHHSNNGERSTMTIRHYLESYTIDGKSYNKKYRLTDQTEIKKVFYANGTVEEDPWILKTKWWYRGSKPIDSLLVDITVFYPTEVERVKLPVDQPQKWVSPEGGFIEVINTKNDTLLLAITQEINRDRKASFEFRFDDGSLAGYSSSGSTPFVPTPEMYAYARTLHPHCSKLVNKIDEGVITSMEQLLEEHRQTAPPPPDIQYINYRACKVPPGAKFLEVTYVSATDSILVTDILMKPEKERQCNYEIFGSYGLVDMDGICVIDPKKETGPLEEVTGIFFRHHVNSSKKSTRLLVPNFEFNKMDTTFYDMINLWDQTFLHIQEEKKAQGILHRDGPVLIPTDYQSITYDSDSGYFIAQLQSNPDFFLLFDSTGKRRFPHAYRGIKVKNKHIYLTYPILNPESGVIYTPD